MIPKDFESWRICITKQCQIALTSDFAQQRLSIYKQLEHPETKLFIQWYGLAHYQRIINWFTIIEKEKNED